jgi:DNA-binding CsgD family transcriptional regulator
MTSLDEVARGIVGLFERLGIPYAIMGGLAVRTHALPRPTFDVDFTVLLPRDALAGFYHSAERLGFLIPAAQKTGWIEQIHGLPLVKLQWFVGERAIDVDVFLAETPFQRQLLDRRERHEVDGHTAWFVTAEDLILLKLLAGRPKDRADIADILFIQGQLDEAHMRRWAEKLGVDRALAEVLAEREP